MDRRSSGSAVELDGTTQFGDAGEAVIDTGYDCTASAWVRMDDTDGFQTAVSQDGDVGSAFYLQYSDADDRFAFSFASARALAAHVGRRSLAAGTTSRVSGTSTPVSSGSAWTGSSRDHGRGRR